MRLWGGVNDKDLLAGVGFVRPSVKVLAHGEGRPVSGERGLMTGDEGPALSDATIGANSFFHVKRPPRGDMGGELSKSPDPDEYLVGKCEASHWLGFGLPQ